MRGTGSAGARLALVMTAGFFVTTGSPARCIQAPAQSQIASHQTAQQGSKAFQDLASRADEARDAGRLDEAQRLYRRALALNPKWTEGWWSLGTLYYDSDRYAEAEMAFEKVVALDPKQGTARAMLGLCEFEVGQFDRALRDIEASKTLGVLEDEQLRNVVTYHESVLLQRAGRFEAAKEALSS